MQPFDDLAGDEVPQIDARTPFREVYRELNRRHRGAFRLLRAGRAVGYVNALELAETVVGTANGDLDKLSLRTDQAIGQVVVEFREQLQLVAEAPEPMPLTSGPPGPGAAVDTSNRRSERQTGGFLDEALALGTLTARTIFICKRNHRNTDFDHGKCSSCPAPFVRTERED